jgi:HSP20 family protein
VFIPDINLFTGEPAPEIHRIGEDVKVVVEMPGVSEENVNIRLDGQSLTIDAAGCVHTYYTHAEVPPVDPASMQHSLKNGVLEVTIRVLPEKDEKESGSTA